MLLTCNEFGVYTQFAPAASRKSWIMDARTTLQQNRIGWTMWEYDEGFGLTTHSNPTTRTGVITDTAALQALGLWRRTKKPA